MLDQSSKFRMSREEIADLNESIKSLLESAKEAKRDGEEKGLIEAYKTDAQSLRGLRKCKTIGEAYTYMYHLDTFVRDYIPEDLYERIRDITEGTYDEED